VGPLRAAPPANAPFRKTTLTLVLRQSGRVSIHSEALPLHHRLRSAATNRVVEHAAHSSLHHRSLYEVGAPAILHDRVDLLTIESSRSRDVLPRQPIEHIQNVLGDEHSIQRQFVAVERFLLSRIEPKTEPPSLLKSRPRSISSAAPKAGFHCRHRPRHAAMSQSALEMTLSRCRGRHSQNR